MSRASVVALLTFALCGSPGLAQGRLQQSRGVGRAEAPPAAAPAGQPASPPGPPDRREPEWYAPSGPAVGEGYAALGVIGLLAATSPFWLPPAMLGDRTGVPAAFPGHPYAQEYGGYLVVRSQDVDNEGKDWLDRDYLKPWGLRLAGEDGNNFAGVNRAGGSLFFDTASRWGVAARYDVFTERLLGGGSDQTSLGDAYLTYRFAQSERAQFHVGVGARFQIDRHQERAGFSFLYSADYFPADPLVFSAQFDLGHLHKYFAARGRATMGVQLHRWELFGGFEFQRVGKANLQGPLIGLRRWF